MEQFFKKQYEALVLELVEVAEDVITGSTSEVDYPDGWGNDGEF